MLHAFVLAALLLVLPAQAADQSSIISSVSHMWESVIEQAAKETLARMTKQGIEGDQISGPRTFESAQLDSLQACTNFCDSHMAHSLHAHGRSSLADAITWRSSSTAQAMK